jgi:hypothetical protein
MYSNVYQLSSIPPQSGIHLSQYVRTLRHIPALIAIGDDTWVLGDDMYKTVHCMGNVETSSQPSLPIPLDRCTFILGRYVTLAHLI